jgi:pimeloyl-ACP methyl ester carboxylesterase
MAARSLEAQIPARLHGGQAMSAFRKLAAILSAGAAGAGFAAYTRYLREMRTIRSAVATGGTVAQTSAGPIEYAEQGQGEPLLLIHGAGGGYDQGLLIGRDFGEGRRIIAPSRFGYLRTPVPEDSSPAAQADVHAALLDHLGVDKVVVVGVSAGGPSAIELALRHPNRVSALVLIVPRTYDPTQSIGVDESMQSQAVLRLIESSADFLYWVAMRVARAAVVRFLGVPPELEANAPEADRDRVTEVMRSVLPLSSRLRGISVDSSIELTAWPLERLRVPTLIVSAKDDLFGTLPGARFTAEHIPGAELKVLENGGHLMVGQSEQVRKWVSDFLQQARSGGRKAALPRRDQTVTKVLEPVV